MKFRPTEFLNTPYRVSCYIKLYRKLFSVMRPEFVYYGPKVHRGQVTLSGLDLAFTKYFAGNCGQDPLLSP